MGENQWVKRRFSQRIDDAFACLQLRAYSYGRGPWRVKRQMVFLVCLVYWLVWLNEMNL